MAAGSTATAAATAAGALHRAGNPLSALVPSLIPPSTMMDSKVMHCIGMTHADLGEYDLAVEQFANALTIQRAVVEESHPHTSMTKKN